jgi:hypothetical protein
MGTAPPVETAHKAKVHTVKGVLDHSEVQAIKDLAAEVGPTLKQHMKHPAWEESEHTKIFLHGENCFQSRLPRVLEKLVNAAISVDKEDWGIISECRALEGEEFQGRPQVRCIEFHQYKVGGNLMQEGHYDEGSLVTMSVRLSSPSSFEGGQFKTFETDGKMKEWHVENEGDALFFPSHKYHSVMPVTTGIRHALVMELWAAKACKRSHRCRRPFDCSAPVGKPARH